MSEPIVRNEAFVLVEQMFDTSDDPVDISSGVTVTVSKDGAAFAASDNSPSNLSAANGIFTITLSADETDCAVLSVLVTHGSANNRLFKFRPLRGVGSTRLK